MEKSINEKEQCVQTDVKCRFFAQYWGQRVWMIDETLGKVDDYIQSTLINRSFLKLKPLSKITDEDKNVLEESIIGFISNMFQIGYFVYIDSESSISDKKMTTPLNTYHLDYLRSKGYAVPFMQYSVDDLVKIGWVQLV